MKNFSWLRLILSLVSDFNVTDLQLLTKFCVSICLQGGLLCLSLHVIGASAAVAEAFFVGLGNLIIIQMEEKYEVRQKRLVINFV